MGLKRLGFIVAAAIGIAAAQAHAAGAFIFRSGDSVWVDGQKYTWEEWKKIRDDPELVKQSQEAKAAPPKPAPGEPRAATCATTIFHDEFPGDDERFQCSAGLGALTRQQILEKGWKVDLIEKIPPPSGQPTQSPRGLPLYSYKLVISR